MPRPRTSPKTQTRVRGARASIPRWWIELAENRAQRDLDEDGDPITMRELGTRLATVAKRQAPWSHTAISKFFGGHVVTAEVANALGLLYEDLPLYAYFPADAAEALEYEMVRKRFDAQRKRASGSIDRHLGVIDRISERALAPRRAENAQASTSLRVVESTRDEQTVVAGDTGKGTRGGRGRGVEPGRGTSRRS
jgi:hypothetical protein